MPGHDENGSHGLLRMSETSKSGVCIIEMRRISKTFGAVRALVDVDLILKPGEILGLVGDNSAGKSTLMKILTGAYHRDSGDISSPARRLSSPARTRAASSASR